MIMLSGARRLAGQHGYEEIYFNEASRVVSFKSYEVRVNALNPPPPPPPPPVSPLRRFPSGAWSRV